MNRVKRFNVILGYTQAKSLYIYIPYICIPKVCNVMLSTHSVVLIIIIPHPKTMICYHEMGVYFLKSFNYFHKSLVTQHICIACNFK